MGVDERLSLEAVSAHTLIAVEHRHRYVLAARACAGKRVLDLCCGVGYGSEILSGAAASVVGVDRDAAAVHTAAAEIAAANASFVAADALDHLRTLEADAIDLVVCFEGLEHVPDVEKVVEQLARLVADGVGLIASVPNSATFEEENEYHLTDFDLASVRALFSAIPGTTIGYQTHAEGSLIRGRAAGEVRASVQLSGEQDLDWANHFLVLAGVDAEGLLASADADLQLAVAPVSHRYMRHLEQANRSLLATNGRLARERFGLGAGGAASATLRREDELAASRRSEEELRRELEELRRTEGELRAELEAVRQTEGELRRALEEELRRAQLELQRSQEERRVSDEERRLSEVERRRLDEERLRSEEELRLGREQARGRVAALETALAALRAERDGYRHAWMVVHTSRITRAAARVAGHRFDP